MSKQQQPQTGQDVNANDAIDKNTLSSDDIANGEKTFEPGDKRRMALETPDGKNNGAEPAAFKGTRKSHP